MSQIRTIDTAVDPTDLGRGTTMAMLALAVVVATALRFIGGGDQLWYDEIVTLVDSVRKPFVDIVTHFPSDNGHVFYSVLAHISIALGGDTPLMLRLPAILLGIASIPLIYVMGTRVTTRFEALAAAMLATVAAYHIWFSQNARGYTLLLVLTLLGTQLILDGLKTRSRRPWLLFAVASALGAYTHVSMILAVFGQAIAVALYLLATGRFTVEELKGPAIGFIGAAALTVLLYLPMLGDVAGFFGAQATTPKPPPAGFDILDLFRNLQFGLVSGARLDRRRHRLPSRPRQLLASVAAHPGSVLHPAGHGPPRHRPARQAVATALLFLHRRLPPPRRRSRRLRHHPVRTGSAGAAMGDVGEPFAVGGRRGDDRAARGRSEPDLRQAENGLRRCAGLCRCIAPANDTVALAGIGADFVYTRFYNRNWPRLTGAGHLASLRRSHDVLVVHTFERPLGSADPALLDAIKTSCTEEREFAGTLQDGDIYVSRCARRP